MTHPWLLGIGTMMAVLGFLMLRWAGRYDAAGIATDAAWRMVKTRSTSGAKDELGKVLDEQTRELRADAARIGMTRTAVKHGGRFFIARFVSVVGIVMMLLGLVAGAAAFVWT